MSIDLPMLDTMYEQLHATVERYPNSTALIYYGTHLSFSQLDDLVNGCAAGLKALGVKKGDRVTICMPNLPQTIAVIYAVNKIGAVCNMLHPLSAASEVKHGVELVKSKVAFCFDISEKAFDGLPVTLICCKTAQFFEKTPVGFVRGKVYLHRTKDKRAPAQVGHKLSWQGFLDGGKSYLKRHGIPPTVGTRDDTAAIMYTGGTTGSPKGVMLSNDAVNHLSFQMFPIAKDVLASDGMLGALPVFHGFGFALCMHTAMCVGMRYALIPRFDPKDCCSMILKEKISLIFSVPAFFEGLLKCGGLKGQDLSFIRLVGSGGDMVSDDLKARMDALLKEGGSNTYLISGYGLTECVTACTMAPPAEKVGTGCVGTPFDGNEMKVVRLGSTEAVLEEDGEICITGPTLMKGYWQDEEETAKVLKRHADGKLWLHTGDIGRIGRDGQLYFKQRLKRVLKVSGYLIYPSVIEERLRCNSLVEDCCVVGVQTASGTKVKAYVVPQRPAKTQTEQELLAEELKRYSSQTLNRWSIPAQVEFLPELPRTKIGKVDFKALEARQS